MGCVSISSSIAGGGGTVKTLDTKTFACYYGSEMFQLVPGYETPDKALDKCLAASVGLAIALRKSGVEAYLVRCEDYIGDESGFHPYLEGADTHFLVRVGNTYIDFTARQFFPDAPYPQVLQERDITKLWGMHEDEPHSCSR